MEEEKELTFGEKAVGIGFNPSMKDDVNVVKRSFSRLIDLCNEKQMSSYLGNLIKGAAIRSCIECQMIIVKLITLKE